MGNDATWPASMPEPDGMHECWTGRLQNEEENAKRQSMTQDDVMHECWTGHLQDKEESADRQAEKECAYWFAWRQLLTWTAGLDLCCSQVTVTVTVTGHERQWRPSSWTGMRTCGCSMHQKVKVVQHSMPIHSIQQLCSSQLCTQHAANSSRQQRQLVNKSSYIP